MEMEQLRMIVTRVRNETLKSVLDSMDDFMERLKQNDRVGNNSLNKDRRSGFLSCFDKIKNIIKKKIKN
jgi:hypothetical protein